MLKTARRIVVGVDGSEESLAALRWAIGQARLTNAALEVFYAFEEPLPVPYSPTIRVPAGEFAEDAHTELDDVITSELDGNGRLPVTTSVIKGRAADVLIDAARGADLLVLGSSGVWGIVGVLEGSTDYSVIHRAPCPVVLVPHHEEAEVVRHRHGARLVPHRQDAG